MKYATRTALAIVSIILFVGFAGGDAMQRCEATGKAKETCFKVMNP